jgi:hypothetical protein
MGLTSSGFAFFLLAAVALMLSSCGTPGMLQGRGAPIPPDDILYSKIAEVGHAMGMTLVYEDKKEVLFIWRIVKGKCDGRFVWYVKRAGNELGLNDPAQGRGGRGSCEVFVSQVPRMQAEFKRRFFALAGPIRLRGPTKSHSSKVMIEAMFDSYEKK